MELVIEPFQALPCSLKVFTINTKGANLDDFGNMYDHDTKIAKPYECANMYFDPKPPTKKVLHKYNITKEEYYSICDELEDKLYVGRCGWCV